MEKIETYNKKEKCWDEIASSMLKNYKNSDKKEYLKLIDWIYSDSRIARVPLCYDTLERSFLYATLLNHGLILTENQKEFVIEEALYHRLDHGGSECDIRYQILKNPNWTIEEKEKLVYNFYPDDYDYCMHLIAFEHKVANHPANY